MDSYLSKTKNAETHKVLVDGRRGRRVEEWQRDSHHLAELSPQKPEIAKPVAQACIRLSGQASSQGLT
jgi:hypothetical protein